MFENDRKFGAFPTYPFVLLFKGDATDVVSFPSKAMMKTMSLQPKLPGVKVGLDGERYIEKIRDLDPKGGHLTLRERLVGVHKRKKGASVEAEQELVDENGQVIYRMMSSTFLVGARDFESQGTEHFKPIKPPSDRAADASIEMTTSPTQTHVYRLSGDYNPLHLDPRFAKISGFKAPILHGLCSLGISARAVLDTYAGGNGKLFKSMKVRFASPVMPGDTLVVDMWKEDNSNKIIFQTKVKSTGKICINNAFIELHDTAAVASL